MSLNIILILLALSGVGGIVFGYVLRVLIGLASRGSVELAANLSAEKAREELFGEIERAHEEAILLRLQKLEAHGRDILETKARAILTAAVHRLGNAVNADMTSLSVAIPSEEMKGKIIG